MRVFTNGQCRRVRGAEPVRHSQHLVRTRKWRQRGRQSEAKWQKVWEVEGEELGTLSGKKYAQLAVKRKATMDATSTEQAAQTFTALSWKTMRSLCHELWRWEKFVLLCLQLHVHQRPCPTLNILPSSQHILTWLYVHMHTPSIHMYAQRKVLWSDFFITCTWVI